MPIKSFPASSKYKNETPVWLRLTYFEYEKYFSNRQNQSRWISGSPNAIYWLPLPANVGTSTRIQASDDASLLVTQRSGMLNPAKPYVDGPLTNPTAGQPRKKVVPSTGQDPGLFLRSNETYHTSKGGLVITANQHYGTGVAGMYGNIGGNKPDVLALGELATTGKNSEGYVDIQDTAWYGQNKKQFEFNFNLKAKSIIDSEQASTICNDFSNLILPSIQNINCNQVVYNQRVTHPGVWGIDVVMRTGQDVTDLWLGRYPQPCLLMSVDAVRVGNQTQGGIFGMLDQGGNYLYPIQYSLTLKYQEIEPSYVAKDYSNIEAYRRSRFMTE